MKALKLPEGCISQLMFDTWFGGELEREQARELEVHLLHCTRCSVRGDRLSAEREAYLARVPSWDALSRKRGHASSKLPQPRVVWAGSALLAAAALLLFVVPRGDTRGIRSKGGPHIGVFIKRGESVTRAQVGDAARPGDLLRLTYTATLPLNFAVLHRDHRTASVYYPLASHTVTIEPGRDVPLDFSIRLDSVPGEEQLYGVFCNEETLIEPLRAALEASGKLASSAQCQVDKFVLTKP